MADEPNEPEDDWDAGGFDIDDAPTPPQTQYPPREPHRRQFKADDGLVMSILVMLCCCQPLGIVAIVFSAMAMSANGSGDYDTAHRHAKLAKQFGLWGLWLGVAYYAIFIVFYAFVMAAAMASS